MSAPRIVVPVHSERASSSFKKMSSSTLLCLTAVAALLLPAAAVVQARIVTDVTTTPHHKPGLKPNAACASTDDPVQCDLYTATNGEKWHSNTDWLNGSSYCGWYNGGYPMCDSSGNVIKL